MKNRLIKALHLWRSINSEFYLEIDRMWMDRKENKSWVRMYEDTKLRILGNSEYFRWRKTNGEIEIKELEKVIYILK